MPFSDPAICHFRYPGALATPLGRVLRYRVYHFTIRFLLFRRPIMFVRFAIFRLYRRRCFTILAARVLESMGRVSPGFWL